MIKRHIDLFDDARALVCNIIITLYMATATRTRRVRGYGYASTAKDSKRDADGGEPN